MIILFPRVSNVSSKVATSFSILTYNVDTTLLHNNSILWLVFQLFFIRGTPLHLSKLQHLLWFMPLSTNKKPLVSSRQCSCGMVDCSDLYLCERVMNSPCLSELHIVEFSACSFKNHISIKKIVSLVPLRSADGATLDNEVQDSVGLH